MLPLGGSRGMLPQKMLNHSGGTCTKYYISHCHWILHRPSNLHMIDNPCGATRKRHRTLESCFGLISPHQQRGFATAMH